MLEKSIRMLSGVGEKRALLYKSMGIDTVSSLLEFYPRDYLDYTQSVLVADCQPNQTCVIRATIIRKMPEYRIKKGLSIFKAIAVDENNDMFTITIFNSVYKFNELILNNQYYFYGKMSAQKEMASPQFLLVTENMALMQPIYPLTAGITQKMIQLLQRQALCHINGVEDAIPDKIRESYNLCHYQFAIENIHFPKDTTALELAKRRLIFEELLIFGLGVTMLRKSRIVQKATPIKNTDISAFIKALPFTLTQGQQDAISDGLADMQQSVPMNRLCQGDVGCGKTMVASALAYACAINGFQTAIMAPTQILAEQHYKTISQLLQPLGISVCLVTSKMNNRKEIISNIKNGTISIVIGTHAILTDDVEFDKLNLVVTDEQHRFGVSQRSKLSQKGENPHLLVMSATPIPRTLALIIYGDLDISVIAQLPNGRQKIETYSVSSKKRARALNFIKKHIDEGRQAYIVCPLIEENESDLISTNEYMDMVKSTPLNEYSIALLDGKMKNSEKEKVMSDFRDNKIKLLIATSVVEVGVDVPNAVVMLIENAERFGLSQLHQLRGRVGRGEYQSYCILISDNQSEDTKKRLSVMTKTCDGFEIANQDLMQRGPGDFFGVKQHGLPKMKIANLVSDMQTLQETQKIAIEILQQDSDLSNHKLLKEKVEKLFSQTKQDILN